MHDSSIGLGHQPFTLVRRVRFPYRVPYKNTLSYEAVATVVVGWSANSPLTQYSVFLYGKFGDVAEWLIAPDCKSGP